MPTLVIHDLDEELVRDLHSRAKANNRSIEAEAREMLTLVVYEDAVIAHQWKKALALADEIRRKTAGRSCTPSEVLIRELRDRDHRL